MIPNFQTLMRPILQLYAERGALKLREIVNLLAENFQLTEAERTELIPSGRTTRLASNAGWANTYLKQARLVEKTAIFAQYAITGRGKECLASGDAIGIAYLDRFEEFAEFKKKRKEKQQNLSATPLAEEEEGSKRPDEVLQEAYEEITDALASELIDVILSSPPAFFEVLIIKLLRAMDYGGASDSNAGQVLGKSGDGGVDGVIDRDPLGVDRVYVQAKRYTDHSVPEKEIRDFAGALQLKGVNSGIFFTTSSFTPAAKNAAEKLRIRTVDGEELADLMIRYSIGCRVEDTLEIKKMDRDFFPISDD